MKEFDAKYRVRDNEDIDARFFDRRFRSLDDRTHSLEERDARFNERIDEVVEDARVRVDGAISPLVEQLFGLQEFGFLVLPIADETAVEFSVGEQDIPTVTGAQADYFFPGAWLALRRTSTIDDWAIAKFVSFDRTLGILSVEITHVGGDEGPHDDVEIVATGGASIAELLTLDQAETLRDLARDWAEKADGVDVDGTGTRSAKHWAGQSAGSATAAAGSATTATTQAGIATTKATEAAGYRDTAAEWASKAEDSVVSGGLFSALHYAAKAAASAAAAALFDPASYYLKTAIDGFLALKADLASPTFTGTPAAPTATAGTNTTQVATTAFVTAAVAPKAPLASPALTGTPTAPTAAAGTNTTQIATTEFVGAAVGFTQIGSPVSMSSSSVAITGIPQIYRDLRFVFNGVSHDYVSTNSMLIQVSNDNGSNWSTDTGSAILTQPSGNTEAWYGVVEFKNYSTDIGQIDGTISPLAGSLVVAGTTNQRSISTRHVGGCNAVRFQIDANNFDAGTVTVFGR